MLSLVPPCLNFCSLIKETFILIINSLPSLVKVWLLKAGLTFFKMLLYNLFQLPLARAFSEVHPKLEHVFCIQIMFGQSKPAFSISALDDIKQ